MIRNWLIFVLFSISCAVVAQETRLKLVFTGDIMGHGTQIASALATGEPGYDYHPCFQHLKPYFDDADIVIGNLEVTLAGPPYKGYPQFSSPDALADALKESGFDILVTANNHALDRRQSGLERTLEQLDQRGILHTGTFANPSSRELYYPLVVEKNGIRLALLNYTYGTNGLKVPPPAIVNRIDTAQIRLDLKKAATAEPDFILVTMHWGDEYQLTENRTQRELAAFLFDQGADAIIGSHPHVVQPIRGEGNGNLVAYSMGNLISNQRNRYRDGGIAFEFELVKGVNGKNGERGQKGSNGEKGARGENGEEGVNGDERDGGEKGDEAERADYGERADYRERADYGERGSEYVGIVNSGYLPIWVHKPSTKEGAMFTLVPAAVDSTSRPQFQMTTEERVKMSQFLKDTRANLNRQREVEPYWIK